ncbi:hypothetical protein OG233_30560 [Streptomyces sp. NBC_01218]|uniref:hypothetical protein n=1 Tax=Streptomyces sp. NBC_01218 TaxID=2903780 RepID=UPI002E1486DE|nr:hypothetical protein OG233_00090 [Streptomyces sp. NBC_01218]WSQ55143.1 hypothetical protein OG233_30560 [Streptomyces sp. NBC_01218]
MKSNRTIAVAVLVCAGLTGVTACGGGSGSSDSGEKKPFAGQSADAIADKAMKATNAADSVHLVGTAQEQGKPVKLDVRVDTKDTCAGSMNEQGVTAEVIEASGKKYIKGDKAFWTASFKGRPGAGKAVPQLAGKWVITPANQAGMPDICDKQAFLAAMDNDKSERQGMKKTGTATVDGKEAVVLKKTNGAETSTLYVAAEGRPYLLKVTTTGGKSPGTMTFSDYDKPVKAPTPPADQIVDPKKLTPADRA